MLFECVINNDDSSEIELEIRLNKVQASTVKAYKKDVWINL